MLQLKVEGMSCGHCVKAVTQAVVSQYPQAEVDIDLASGRVTLKHVDDLEQVSSLIEEAGYKVSEAGSAV